MFSIIPVLLLILKIYCANSTNENLDLRKILTNQNSLDLIYGMNTSNDKYCNLCCINIQTGSIGKSCGSHTLCKYPTNKIGPSCRGYLKIQFTMVEQIAILDVHNTLRNKVAMGLETKGNPGPQPTAANMRLMEWSSELAIIAERWAAQCIYSNDLCRDIDRFPVGQNIARGNVATSNELALINDWYEEVQHFNNSFVGSYTIPRTGNNFSHYAQLVWADAYLLGCARSIFQDSKGPKVFYREHLICNYGPTGNLPNQEVYKIGKPCSECHLGTACNSIYPGLCSTEIKDDLYNYFQKNQIGNNCKRHGITWILITTVNIVLYCLLIKSF